MEIKPYQTISLKNLATIRFYGKTDNPRGTFAIFPGFAQTVINNNPKFQQPLLNTIFTWGLDKEYQMVTVETFVSNLTNMSAKQISQIGYPMFQSLIDECMETVYKNVSEYHIIAHSTPTIPIILNFQNCIESSKPIHANFTTLFAPFPTQANILDSLIWMTKDTPTTQARIKNLSPLANELFAQVSQINPTTLSKLKTPIMFVCGNKDKTAPSDTATNIAKNAATTNIIQTFAKQNHNFSTMSKIGLLKLMDMALKLRS